MILMHGRMKTVYVKGVVVGADRMSVGLGHLRGDECELFDIGTDRYRQISKSKSLLH